MQPWNFLFSRPYPVVKGIFLCYTVKNAGISSLSVLRRPLSRWAWKILLKLFKFIEFINRSNTP